MEKFDIECSKYWLIISENTNKTYNHFTLQLENHFKSRNNFNTPQKISLTWQPGAMATANQKESRLKCAWAESLQLRKMVLSNFIDFLWTETVLFQNVNGFLLFFIINNINGNLDNLFENNIGIGYKHTN